MDLLIPVAVGAGKKVRVKYFLDDVAAWERGSEEVKATAIAAGSAGAKIEMLVAVNEVIPDDEHGHGDN